MTWLRNSCLQQAASSVASSLPLSPAAPPPAAPPPPPSGFVLITHCHYSPDSGHHCHYSPDSGHHCHYSPDSGHHVFLPELAQMVLPLPLLSIWVGITATLHLHHRLLVGTESPDA